MPDIICDVKTKLHKCDTIQLIWLFHLTAMISVMMMRIMSSDWNFLSWCHNHELQIAFVKNWPPGWTTFHITQGGLYREDSLYIAVYSRPENAVLNWWACVVFLDPHAGLFCLCLVRPPLPEAFSLCVMLGNAGWRIRDVLMAVFLSFSADGIIQPALSRITANRLTL